MYIVLFLICVFSMFIIIDVLIRKEYRENYDLWEKDGKPFGFFWVPNESKGRFFPKLKCQMAREKLVFSWLFSTPLWMKSDQKSLLLIRIYRILSLVALISWVLGFSSMITRG